MKLVYFKIKFLIVKIIIRLQSGTIEGGDGIILKGIPYLKVRGKIRFGNNVIINSSLKSNPTNHHAKCVICVEHNATLIIHDNVGISNAVIYASQSIEIGAETMIGSGVKIWDTDFHRHTAQQQKSEKITIGKQCWIGADCTVLKGTVLPNCTTIGAMSLITKSTSPHTSGVYGGHPLKSLNAKK